MKLCDCWRQSEMGHCSLGGRKTLCFYRLPGMRRGLWTSALLAYVNAPPAMNLLVVWYWCHTVTDICKGSKLNDQFAIFFFFQLMCYLFMLTVWPQHRKRAWGKCMSLNATCFVFSVALTRDDKWLFLAALSWSLLVWKYLRSILTLILGSFQMHPTHALILAHGLPFPLLG